MVNLPKHQLLYKETGFHAAFPSIVRLNDNSLVLAFRRARDGLWLLTDAQRALIDPFARMDHIDSRSHIAMIDLDHNGKPVDDRLDFLPVDPEAADQDPSMLVLPDGRLFLASFSWYPLPEGLGGLLGGKKLSEDEQNSCHYLYWGSHTSLRRSDLKEWSAHHRYIDLPGVYGRQLSSLRQKPVSPPLRGQPLQWNGRILLPLYSTRHKSALLVASDNEGESWSFMACIAKDSDSAVSYQEPALCHDGKGGIVCFMRTKGAQGRLVVSHSEDGLKWSTPVLHQLYGQPFHPLLLFDGRLLLTYGYRQEPYGIRGRLMDNPMQNPDKAEEFIIRDDGLCPDLGYPWSVQLENGQVLTVYYMVDDKGVRHISGSWLDF